MNETTPPNDSAGPSGPNSNSPGAFDRFYTWLRGLGITRGTDRWFAGVAAGIARKANIDPIIVRGVFVVLAVLGGPGILLYLAAWLLLPDLSGRIHLEELFRGRASTGVTVVAIVLAVLLVLPAIFWVLRSLVLSPWSFDTWGFLPQWMQVLFGVLWWALVVPGLIIWLIWWFTQGNRSGSDQTGQVQPDEQTDQASRRPKDWSESFSQKAGEWGEQVGQKADEWGQKVNEKTGEWDQWSREYQAKHQPGAAFVTISLALSLLVAGGTAIAVFTSGASSATTLMAGLLTGVATLAIAMIVSGVRGRSSGWVGFVALCGTIALIFAPVSTVLPQHAEFVPFGNSTIRPSDASEDRAVFTLFGNSTVDLTDLDTRATPKSIDVWVLAGNVTVRLPQSTPTVVRVNMLAGNVRDERLGADDRRQGGIFLGRTLEQHAVGLDRSEVVEVRVRIVGGNAYVEGPAAGVASREQTEEIERLQRDIDERLQREIDEREQLQERIDELEAQRNELENAR
jgi:phage shock protein PspC (stress-responsive transcriptional regulator)